MLHSANNKISFGESSQKEIVGSDALTDVWHTFTLTYSWTKVNSVALNRATWNCSQVSCSLSLVLSPAWKSDAVAWHEQFHLVKLSTSCQMAACLCLCVNRWMLIESGISHSCSWYSFQWLLLGHGPTKHLIQLSYCYISHEAWNGSSALFRHYCGVPQGSIPVYLLFNLYIYAPTRPNNNNADMLIGHKPNRPLRSLVVDFWLST